MELTAHMEGTQLTRQGYVVPKESLPREALQKLTMTPLQAPGAPLTRPPDPVEFFHRDGDNIILPTQWALENLGAAGYDARTFAKSNLKFKGMLQPHQPEAVEATLKQLKKRGGAVLSLYTGAGKTTCALYIAAQLQCKTLIVVHTTTLLEQWQERIRQFLPGASIGVVQGARAEFSADVIVAMMQTLMTKKYAFDDVGLLVVDECFPYRQMIMTENGPMTIGMIYKYWKQGTRIRVQSFNEKTWAFELRDVTYAWEKQATELVKVSYSKSNYRATSNHPVLTTEGWKATGDIVPGDLLFSRYTLGLDEQAVALAMNSDQYQVFLGSLLGDGHLHNLPSQRYRLKVTHGPKQLEYIEWKARIFGAKTRSFVGGYLNDTEYEFSTRVIDLPSHKTFQSHKSHKTHCPQWVLDELDERGLAIWIMDDASLSRTGGMCIHTNTFDEDSQRRMCLKLGSMGIDATYRTTRHYITLSTSSGRTAARLIAPYIHPSMACKVINPRALISAETVGTHVWNRAFLDYGTLRVGSTEKYVPLDPRVYDLEVQGTHTFVCASIRGNGPVVHNCHHIAARAFSQVMFGLACPFTLGLSATPHRKDGLTDALWGFLGPLSYLLERTEAASVQVCCLRYGCAAYLEPLPTTRRGDLDFTTFMTDLSENDERTRAIVDAIAGLATDPTRHMLVLSHRRTHCRVLVEYLQARTIDAAVYLGGVKRSKGSKGSKGPPDSKVIVSTYSLAAEGMDIPRLNTLILATPASDVTQACGRILRGSNTPIIVDVVDEVGIGHAQAAKRRRFYARSGFKYAPPMNARRADSACLFI